MLSVALKFGGSFGKFGGSFGRFGRSFGPIARAATGQRHSQSGKQALGQPHSQSGKQALGQPHSHNLCQESTDVIIHFRLGAQRVEGLGELRRHGR